MTTTAAKKTATPIEPPPPLQPVVGASTERGGEIIPPAVDPLVEEERAPRAFDIGDVVEFTDSIKFQFGAQKTYQQGVVVGVVEGDGMLIVATGMQDSMAYDSPRVEYVFEGRETAMRKVASDGE